MTLGAKVFAMIAAAAGAPQASSPPKDPISLSAQPSGDAVRIAVTGRSATDYRANFTVTIESDAAAGNNRSVQSGVAALRPNQSVTLLNVTLGNVARGQWKARLVVEPATGERYERLITSGDAATAG